MKTNRKRMASLLCLASVLLLSGCGGDDAPEAVLDSTVSVTTMTAERGSLATDGKYVGSVSSEDGTSTVVAMVSGNVEEVAVEVGDTVKAGQLLCRFDDEAAGLTLKNARASYQSAAASFGQQSDGSLEILEEQVRTAQKNYDDLQALLEIGAAAPVEVDAARQALLAAQAALKSTELNLESIRTGVESAEYQMTLYHLTAPISGTVESVNVVENNFTPSGTAAFVISNASSKTVTFYVPNDVRESIQPGQGVSVTNVGETYQGAVTEVGGIVTADGLFRVKAVLDDALALPDGLSVELITSAHLEAEAVLVPTDALYFDTGDTAYVYIAQDGKAVRRDVTIGLYSAETAAVTEGLDGGEEVIVTWSAGLKDGAPIRVGDASAEPGIAVPEESAAPEADGENIQTP